MKNNKQIIEEFEKRFYMFAPEAKEQVKFFILNALSSQRQEFKEMVKGMEVIKDGSVGDFAFLFNKGFNQALTDILNKLEDDD